MEEVPPQKRKSLRDSVLKRPTRRQRSLEPFSDHDSTENNEEFFKPPGGSFFGSFAPMFNMDRDDFPLGSEGFGDIDRFRERFNEMMGRFSSDFQPESFSDSQFYNEDRDLDEDVSSRGLDKALETHPKFDRPRGFFSGFSHSESITTKSDGTTERRVTHKDSQGNVETTVTITHPDGTTETMDDGRGPVHDIDEVSDFNIRTYGSREKGLLETIYDNFKRFF